MDHTTSSGPPAMGVFVIPNEKIGNVDLTHFQVSLEKLEAYTGTIFHSKLDRDRVSKCLVHNIVTEIRVFLTCLKCDNYYIRRFLVNCTT